MLESIVKSLKRGSFLNISCFEPMSFTTDLATKEGSNNHADVWVNKYGTNSFWSILWDTLPIGRKSPTMFLKNE